MNLAIRQNLILANFVMFRETWGRRLEMDMAEQQLFSATCFVRTTLLSARNDSFIAFFVGQSDDDCFRIT